MANKWILSWCILVLSFSGKAQQVILEHIKASEGALSNFHSDVCIDAEGRAILSSDAGLVSYNGEFFKPLVSDKDVSSVEYIDGVVYYASENQIIALPSGKKVAEIPQGKLISDFSKRNGFWVILSQNELFTRGQKAQNKVFDNTIHLVHDIKESSYFYYGAALVKMDLNSLSESGVLTFDAPIVSVGASQHSLVVATEDEWTQFDRNDLSVKSSGNGSMIQNLSVIDDHQFLFSDIYGTHSYREGQLSLLNIPKVREIPVIKCVKDRYSGMWFLTAGNGTFFSPHFDIQYLNNSDQITAVSMTDRSLFATSQGGLFERKKNGTSVSLWNGKDIHSILPIKDDILVSNVEGCFLIKPSGTTEKLFDAPVHDLKASSDLRYVYGRTLSTGVFSLERKSGNIELLGISSGISHNSIRFIEVVENTLYVFPEAGIPNLIIDGRYSGSDFSIGSELWNPDLVDYSSKHKKLLLYRVNGTLTTLSTDGKTVQQYQTLPSARKIAIDGDKCLLVGSSEAFVIQLSSGKTSTFHLPVSLVNEQFTEENANYRNGWSLYTSKGTLFIGSNVNQFRPSLVKISQILLNGKSIKIAPDIELEYGENNLRIRFEVIDLYDRLRKDNFNWKLLGSKDESRKKIYENEISTMLFSEGTYSVLIDQDGTNQKIEFHIPVPYWKQLWFWGLIFVGLVILTILFVTWRTRSLRKERDRLEMLVNKRTEQIQERNADLEQVAYALSHDFKTPLQTVHQILTIQQEKDLNPEEAMVYSMVSDKTGALLNNMSGLIDLLKVDLNAQKFESISLSEIIDEVLESLHGQIEESDAEIIKDFQGVQLEGVRPLVFSIFHNLIGNALKYRKPNVAPFIQVRAQLSEKKLSIQVEDNGLGIDLKSNKESVFRPFKQVNSKSDGVGLGLSLVKRMVAFHQGTIILESELDKGTTFTITIPLQRV